MIDDWSGVTTNDAYIRVPHSYAGPDSFTCHAYHFSYVSETWLANISKNDWYLRVTESWPMHVRDPTRIMCDISLTWVWRNSSTCPTRPTYTCDTYMTDTPNWRDHKRFMHTCDSFICGTRHFYVRNISYERVAWLVNICVSSIEFVVFSHS